LKVTLPENSDAKCNLDIWTNNDKEIVHEAHRYFKSLYRNGGNAQNGSLKTMYDGAPPNGYSPMRKEGAVFLLKNNVLLSKF
jgi:hypothetical protein